MEKQIRILHVIGIMNRGGAETFIMNMYRHIDRKKVQFDFVEGSTEPAFFDDEIIQLGGKIYRCPKFNGKNLYIYRKWWIRFFCEHASEYTAVHGHIGSTAAIYLSLAKKYGLHTIAHSHNTYNSLRSSSARQIAYRCFSYPTRYIADSFFACSKEAGVSRFGLRPDCKVVKNGIDTASFDFNETIRKIKREELNIDSNTKVYGHVGRFSRQKNHSFLIEIMEKIYEKEKNSVLLLIGDGPLKQSIAKLVKEKGLESQVIFLGVRSDISDLLQCMDVFIFPSLYEGFGIAALEAQTSGLPVLCSDKVSKDCYVTDLVYPISLELDAEYWADTALTLSSNIRKSYKNEVKNHGFDIVDVAKEMESFYLGLRNYHD